MLQALRHTINLSYKLARFYHGYLDNLGLCCTKPFGQVVSVVLTIGGAAGVADGGGAGLQCLACGLCRRARTALLRVLIRYTRVPQLNYLRNKKYESTTPFTRGKTYLDRDQHCNLDCDMDRDPEDVPAYTGHLLFNKTKRITLSFIVQSL